MRMIEQHQPALDEVFQRRRPFVGDNPTDETARKGGAGEASGIEATWRTRRRLEDRFSSRTDERPDCVDCRGIEPELMRDPVQYGGGIDRKGTGTRYIPCRSPRSSTKLVTTRLRHLM